MFDTVILDAIIPYLPPQDWYSIALTCSHFHETLYHNNTYLFHELTSFKTKNLPLKGVPHLDFITSYLKQIRKHLRNISLNGLVERLGKHGGAEADSWSFKTKETLLFILRFGGKWSWYFGVSSPCKFLAEEALLIQELVYRLKYNFYWESYALELLQKGKLPVYLEPITEAKAIKTKHMDLLNYWKVNAFNLSMFEFVDVQIFKNKTLFVDFYKHMPSIFVDLQSSNIEEMNPLYSTMLNDPEVLQQVAHVDANWLHFILDASTIKLTEEDVENMLELGEDNFISRNYFDTKEISFFFKHIQKYPSLVKFMPHTLRDNKEFMLTAMQRYKNYLFLRVCSDTLKKDKEIITAALQQNIRNIFDVYASDLKKYLEDVDYLKQVAPTFNFKTSSSFLTISSAEFMSKELLHKLMDIAVECYILAPNSLRLEKEFIIRVIQQGRCDMLPKSVYNDLETYIPYLREVGEPILPLMKEKHFYNSDWQPFVLEELRNNFQFTKYLHSNLKSMPLVRQYVLEQIPNHFNVSTDFIQLMKDEEIMLCLLKHQLHFASDGFDKRVITFAHAPYIAKYFIFHVPERLWNDKVLLKQLLIITPFAYLQTDEELHKDNQILALLKEKDEKFYQLAQKCCLRRVQV